MYVYTLEKLAPAVPLYTELSMPSVTRTTSMKMVYKVWCKKPPFNIRSSKRRLPIKLVVPSSFNMKQHWAEHSELRESPPAQVRVMWGGRRRWDAFKAGRSSEEVDADLKRKAMESWGARYRR